MNKANLIAGVVEARILDCPGFLNRVGGDRELACVLIQVFLEDSPAMMTAIADAIQTGNPARLQFAAHALRGTVANYGADIPQELAHQLEQMGRVQTLMSAGMVYARLIEAVDRLRAALKELESTLRL